MHWTVKAAAFRAIDAMPLGSALHFAMQRYLTKNWPRPDAIIDALDAWAETVKGTFEPLSPTPFNQAAFLEIGAGRDLAVPMALKALGAGSVTAVDISRLAKLPLIRHVARRLAEKRRTSPPSLDTWPDLERYGVSYRAPFDVTRETGLQKVDCFVSNEVLEHIPAAVIPAIFAAVGRSMPKGGVTIHSTDYSDHFARAGSVSRYNFLKYSDEAWKPYNTTFQYVNRLRHSDYMAIIRNAGFRIVDVQTYAEDLPPDVERNLADQFKRYSAEDLRTMRSVIVAVKD